MRNFRTCIDTDFVSLGPQIIKLEPIQFPVNIIDLILIQLTQLQVEPNTEFKSLQQNLKKNYTYHKCRFVILRPPSWNFLYSV